MGINYIAVVLASIAQFIIGAIWYMPIFGKAWGEIHGMDMSKMSKAEQKEAQKGMAPLLLVQFLMTVVTTVVLAKLFLMLPATSVYSLAVMIWVGFFIPVQVSATLFGGTDKKWVVKKSVIQAGGSLLCLLAAAAILHAL